MSALYEINRAILECIDTDTGEIIDVERLAELQIEKSAKLEQIALWYKNLTSDAAQYKAEKDSFAQKQKQAESKAESLKKYLDESLAGNPMKTTRVNVTYRKSKAVEITDEAEFVAWAEDNNDSLIEYQLPKISKTEIKKAIDGGEDIPFTSIVERNNISIK